MNDYLYKKTNYIFLIVVAASLLVSCFGSIPRSPQIVKVIFGTALISLFAFYPYSNIKYWYGGNRFKKIFFLYIGFVAFALVRSAITNESIQMGNKWLTMFGNDECLFMLLTPAFIFLADCDNILYIIKRSLYIFVPLGLLIWAIFGDSSVGKSIWFLCVLIPFLDKKFYILAALVIYAAVYSSFYAEETSRTLMLVLALCSINYVIVYVLNWHKITKVLCILLLVLPIIYSIPMLINSDYSIFGIVSDLLFPNSTNTGMTTDTRSFLFWELAKDISVNKAWLFGKGVYSHYYSAFFDNNEAADHYMRLTSEVTFLTIMLRGGITLVISYYSIIVYGIIKALKYAQNRFCLSVALMASSWFFISFLSYLNGCRFLHLVFFSLLGCCLYDKWLLCSDEDIKKMM